jgi:hypothetical protein
MPASFWTFIKGTPYSAVYMFSGGDSGSGALDFNPTMKGQLAAGPLKAELARLAATSSLNTLNLNLDSARVRIYYVSGLTSPSPLALTIPDEFALYWSTTGLVATGAFGEILSEQIVIEIRFVHSKKR